jgi:prepilin-type N-terminal cleavage/methylation domain-containing protein
MRGKGFTLVEILITLALLGIMVGMVLVVLNPATYREKARNGRRMSDLQVVQGAIEMYYAQQSVYPSGTDATNLNNALANEGGGAWTAGGVTYLSRTPREPLGGTYQAYCYTPNAAGYLLCAQLEGTVDPTWLPGTCNTLSYNYCLQNTY